MLDEQRDQIFATTDVIAERARKLSGTTLCSIGHIHRIQRILDDGAPYVTPPCTLAVLADDNRKITAILRQRHAVCEERNDVATTSQVWIEEAERQSWFFYEATRAGV